MKKILVFLFLLSGSPVSGQVVVTYDFLSDSIHYNKKNPSFGETVQFKVVNINTFRYNAKVSGKEIDFNTDVLDFTTEINYASLKIDSRMSKETAYPTPVKVYLSMMSSTAPKKASIVSSRSGFLL